MIELAVKLSASYLLGSVVGSLLVGRLRGGVDIRTLGSGNAGGTNALRTQGKAFAFWVMLIDIAKGWLAAYVIARLPWPAAGAVDSAVHAWLPVACGAAAIIGHVYPIWHGFRGGKGAATLMGALLAIDPLALAAVVGLWLVAVVLFGYVSLASMLAAVALPFFAGVSGREPVTPLVAFGVFVAALVVFTHRSNLTRLFAGREPRAERLWLLGFGRR
jgi:acyl phosphate:glycerol-3-phosphate acyltransferase